MDTLNDLEIRILKVLENHRGKLDAIGRFVLVNQVNSERPLFPVHERKIRETIKHLVESHGQWIGSCSRGYFMIQTDEELMGVCKYYHGYGLSALHIEAKLRKMSWAALLGQLSIEFVESSKLKAQGESLDPLNFEP